MDRSTAPPILLTALLLATPAWANELLPPTRVTAGDKPIDVLHEGHTAPFVGDFDEDGVDDLLVGEFHEGQLRIYRNVGTNKEPRFDEFQWFSAGGDLGRVPTSCCIGFTPQLIDLDGDGRMDMLSGSWPGELYFFRRNTDGSFAKPDHLQFQDGIAIKPGPASTVFATDWDADGDLDLLIGVYNGDVYLAPNLSGSRELHFGKAQVLASLSSREASHSHPVAADWDGDGVLDLVVGHSGGGVLWFRNQGTAQSPKLDEARELLPNPASAWKLDKNRNPDDWGARSKICITDWNRDGRPDILLGDVCGGFLRAVSERGTVPFCSEDLAISGQSPTVLNSDPAANDAPKDDTARQKLADLRQNWAAAFQQYRELSAQKPDKTAPDHAQRLEETRSEMVRLKEQMTTYQSKEVTLERQSHGYVWLFLRESEHE